MVQAYWHVGRLIVEHEQRGARRATYGAAVLDDLARRLTTDFGRGFTINDLGYMRQFFLAFPIPHALRGEFHRATTRLRRGAGSAALRPASGAFRKIRPELSWTHYRLLLRVTDAAARAWYMNEAANEHWSTRQLDRQIRDPYVLEFLDLKDYPSLREPKVEQTIIHNIQAFLLELGKGFSFVARQKRMRFEDEDFYVDLVFPRATIRPLASSCARRKTKPSRITRS